jgi:hypothetical protein
VQWSKPGVEPSWEPIRSFDSDKLIQAYWNTQSVDTVPKRFKKGVMQFHKSFKEQKTKFKVTFKQPVQSTNIITKVMAIRHDSWADHVMHMPENRV